MAVGDIFYRQLDRRAPLSRYNARRGALRTRFSSVDNLHRLFHRRLRYQFSGNGAQWNALKNIAEFLIGR